MRFGWLAAAAALVCAGNASAQTFVSYEAQGTGELISQNSGPLVFKTGDLFFRFVVEVDPGYSSGPSYGTGSFFQYQNRSTLFTAGLTSGNIAINFQDFPTQYGASANAAISLNPGGEQTFLAISNESAATGTINYTTITPYGGTRTSGTITRLVKLGTVSQFFSPSADVLPEPGTWAMMIFGTAAIGYGMRRRRAKISAKPARA